VTVHPNLFHKVLERLPITGWQVIDDGDRLRVLIAGTGPGVDPNEIATEVIDALDRVGAHGVRVEAMAVDAIPRTALGKAPLVRRSEPMLAAAGRN
jgi:phenylacetate-CoA ligase